LSSRLVSKKLEDYEYKPLDPSQIKLLTPQPPSDRILKAVEAFYSPSTVDNPRNSYVTILSTGSKMGSNGFDHTLQVRVGTTWFI
jgi:hypothetical protein